MLQPRTAPVASLAAGILAVAMMLGLASGNILPARTTTPATTATPDGYVVSDLRFGDPAVDDGPDGGLTMGALRFSLAGTDHRLTPDNTAVYAVVGAHTVGCEVTQRAIREVPAHVHCNLHDQAARVTLDTINHIEVIAYRTAW